MEIVKSFFIAGYQPLFILSTFTTIIFLLVIVAMALVMLGFYRSNVNSYHTKIKALGQQLNAMQDHLDYASREETKARAHAKRAAAARDNLLTSLSHEIRTPMNGILGMSILLEETSLNHEQKDYIDTIISSGRILLNKVDEVISNELLEQSKIEQSISPVQQKNTDLRNCVEEVIDTFAVRASERSIELLYGIDENVPLQVLTDNKRLYQVLTNLVEKVMETEQQQVFIGVHIIKHDTTGTAPALGFTIAAKPMGNAAAIALLLDSGDALQAAAEEQDEKTLGLAISKKLVEEMKGELKTVGDASIGFIFRVPLQTVASPAGNTTSYNLKDFEGKPVLLVSSNPTVAGVLMKQLQQWKLYPVMANNAEDALQLANEQSFSLAITEMNLTGKNGIELSAAIKNAFPQLPVILLKALNDNRYKAHEAIAKEIIVLSKPVKQHILFDNILSSLLHVKKAGPSSQEMSVKKLSADFSKQYPLRILVAEDNPVNQKWATKILGKLGYQPDIADNGHIVLDMVGKTAYDLILMDVQMPEMDGLEATKMIRVCLNKQPTIIAMTANVMHGDRMACMQAGMDDYISKPVQLAELVNMLEKWALVITDKKLV
jgi:CheY-like chemotaxis protein/nitrogen-specific signal transduction histidine kinase